MNQINFNDPAFPVSPEAFGGLSFAVPGLSIGALFSALAMNGYISAGTNGMPDAETLANLSVASAEALIEKLNSRK